MEKTWRWFGKKDKITLSMLKQIGVEGIVTALHDVPNGEVWTREKIRDLREYIESYGMRWSVVESLPVCESIKYAGPDRDGLIEKYKESLKNLSLEGIHTICYNFMPVFDWTRTELYHSLPDGSKTMRYSQSLIDGVANPQDFVDAIQKQNGKFEMAGWEPERMKEIHALFIDYSKITHEILRKNLHYFLEAVIPVCEKYDIKMAMHPDDPPWDIFGLPRIAGNKEQFDKVLSLVDSPCNCMTLCTGSLGADPENDIPDLIRHFGSKEKIAFAHVRNLKHEGKGAFHESSHLSSDGSLDMFEIMKALYEVGFDGYVRPDHGRMIWGETGRAGYGLYDRALGIAYLNGLWEALVKHNK